MMQPKIGAGSPRRRHIPTVLVAGTLAVALLGFPPTQADTCPRAVDGNDCDWAGTPTYVSGTFAYSLGELIYTDYVHDDRGANVDTFHGGDLDRASTLTGVWPNPRDPTSPRIGGTANNGRFRWAGDYGYPPRSPNDATGFEDVADLLELRVAADAGNVWYLVRLGALLAADDTVVGIGIDADLDHLTGAAEWPRGARLPGRYGYDYFLTLWGTGGELIDYTENPPVATTIPVAANVGENFIEASIPRPTGSEGAVWRHRAGTGLWDAAAARWTEVTPTTTHDRAPGALGLYPNVFDLAFVPWEANTWWRDNKQADDLAERDLSEDYADVSIARLLAGASDPPLRRTGLLNVQYETLALGAGEGIDGNASVFGQVNYVYKAPVQPYALVVPTGYYTDPGPRRFLYFFHCLNCNHNIWPTGVEDAASRNRYHVKDPELGTDHIQRIVDDWDMLVAGSVQRGEGGPGPFGERAGERDLMDIFATIKDRDGYLIDADRVIFGGMSMGGSTTRFMMSLYPDLIAAAIVNNAPGAPRYPENARNVFYAQVNGDTGLDVGAATSGRGAARDLTRRGYANFYLEYLGRAHDFNLVYESLPIVKPLLLARLRDPNPGRVTYTLGSSNEAPALGLVHDRAYWAGDIELAPQAQEGTVDAIALPLAHKLPTKAWNLTGHFTNTFTGNAAFVSWTEYEDLAGRGLGDFDYGWVPGPDVGISEIPLAVPANAGANGFELTTTRLAALSLDAARMGISTTDVITGAVEADGTLALTLLGAWTGAEVVTIDGAAVASVIGGNRLTFAVPDGAHEVEVAP